MNSTIQQLYLIPEFRQRLLLAEDKSADKSDSLLYQAQFLMASLQKAQQAHIQQFIDKFRYNAKRASLVQSRIKKLA
jgi:ATPase subunit of ABC transporter with duplicated ATPase domains